MPSKVVMDVLNSIGARVPPPGEPVPETIDLRNRLGSEVLDQLMLADAHPFVQRLSGRIAELFDMGRVFDCPDRHMIAVLRAYVAAYDSREA
jgi:hypothetical protein